MRPSSDCLLERGKEPDLSLPLRVERNEALSLRPTAVSSEKAVEADRRDDPEGREEPEGAGAGTARGAGFSGSNRQEYRSPSTGL